MRSYDQYCSVARALDVMGDRWTLLIVRELLLQGPCRFTDLKKGLPGIAPNLLSTRLKELETAGLIAREDAPPPVATGLYRLTETGLALEPTVKALALWGLQFMKDERPQDTFRAQWMALQWFVTEADPDGPPATIQLVVGGEPAVVELRGGEVETHLGRAAEPDLVLEGPPRTILGLLNGLIDLDAAARLGLSTSGRLDLLTRLRPIARDRASRPA